MKYALILAGGRGTRMGKTEVPKQFLKIDDIPIIIYTIKQFYNVPGINKIIAVIPKHYQEYLDKLLKKNNLTKVITVVGGSSRYESVLNGCIYIKDMLKSDEETAVISHDAVRPFVSREIINDHINAINFYRAVNTIIPIADTIIELDAGRVVNIPDRRRFFLSQTPQTFYLLEYLQLCSSLSDEAKETVTDICDIYYLNNINVGPSIGETSNFKITTSTDLEFANKIVQKEKIKKLK